ncbi:MAG: hypothetical protein GOP50_08780 [Candidatus Heimdallarchaeota archaeon]|nr:hypothetical protein [Candidatus Heimdallarchaeota archaeon]
MRRLFRRILSLCLTFLVILSLFIPLFQASYSGYTIYTRINNIDFPPHKSPMTFFPNHTLFEFDYSLELINPSGIVLFIRTPSTCLIFNSGNITFEDDQHEGYILSGNIECGAAFTNHEIPPGITDVSFRFYISINGTLESLPYGNYTISIAIPDYLEEHEYVHYPSTIYYSNSNLEILHKGENETFTFPTVPSFQSISSYLLLTFMVGFTIVIVIRRKY